MTKPNFSAIEAIFDELYKYVYDNNYQPDIQPMLLEAAMGEIGDIEKNFAFYNTLLEVKEKLQEILA